jgi:3-isopropylmalate/(R)-2-methylmalate dehydratase small subunit
MTQAFTKLESRLIPIARENIDTDQIIPARYLKVTDKAGLVDGLFYSWRFLPDGNQNPDFPLNQPELQKAQILVAGENFGCGSSREHAPWALSGWGIRAIISTSFADIFRNNAIKNGLLPVVVDAETLAQIFSLVAEEPLMTLHIDLEDQILTMPDGRQVQFPIDQFSKYCLIEGIDQLGYLLQHMEQIKEYEKSRMLTLSN